MRGQDRLKVLVLSQGDLAAADPSSPRIGSMPLRGMEIYSRFFVDSGLTSQLVPPSAIVTNQFIADANDFNHKAFIAQAKQMK